MLDLLDRTVMKEVATDAIASVGEREGNPNDDYVVDEEWNNWLEPGYIVLWTSLKALNYRHSHRRLFASFNFWDLFCWNPSSKSSAIWYEERVGPKQGWITWYFGGHRIVTRYG